jgi:putative sterol carrier protein
MTEYSIQDLLDRLPGLFVPEKAAGIDAVVQFNLSGDNGGKWFVTIRDQKCSVSSGEAAQPRLVFSASAQDCLDVFTGKLDGMRAYMSGRLKLSGDIGMAMKLTSFFDLHRWQG